MASTVDMELDFTKFEQRFTGLQKDDNERHQLISDLMGNLKLAHEELKDKQKAIDREKLMNEALVGNLELTKKTLSSKEQDDSRNKFISVLLDGDHMLFTDDLLKKKAVGGRDAAQGLKQAIRAYIDEIGGPPDYKLVVRVYANVKGLFRAYKENCICSEPADLEDFIRGFNMADPMFDFVDAGWGKECADVKLIETFTLHEADVHCSFVFLGASADNGYARLLDRYVGKKDASNRVVLVEGPPFAAEMKSRSAEFRCTDMPSIFRKSKLAKRLSFSTAQAHLLPPPYAEVAASLPLAGSTTKQEATKPPTNSATSKVVFDGQGRRVDPAPPTGPMAGLVGDIKSRKFCNEYHLRDSCFYALCAHVHGQRLTGHNLEALRVVSRLSACDNGPFCQRTDCIRGHRCMSREKCTRRDCKFQWH